MKCLLCKERDARSRFNVLCLICMSKVHVRIKDFIDKHGPIRSREEKKDIAPS